MHSLTSSEDNTYTLSSIYGYYSGPSPVNISRPPFNRLNTGTYSEASSWVALTLSASGSNEIWAVFLTETTGF